MGEKWKQSIISNKYPTNRDIPLKSAQSWLDGRREDDNAEGLWRIHDSLYDFSDFIQRHPGGPDWLKLTKGIDITELFEAHHISEYPEKLIEKYKVRDTEKPRNITLTIKEDGFYRTLKRRVRTKLATIDSKELYQKSDNIHNSLLAASYLLCIMSAYYQSTFLALIAGLLVNWTVIIAHNYFHRKDNWRMYTFNISMMSYREWRISHAMSHHMYANSYHDLELSLFEPFLCWIPSPDLKNFVTRYLSWIYSPIIYAVIPILQFVKRSVLSLILGTKQLYWDDIIPFTVPLAMYYTANIPLLTVLKIWLIMLLSCGFAFGLIGLTAAHHHPEIVHDGDAMRDNRDWGLYQIDTIIDRRDLKGSQLLVLTHFGEHILHHLFPTLDHGVLPELYPVLYETMADFEGELRECSWIHHIIGQFRQLARITPNPCPPGHQKRKGNKQKFISAH